MKLILGDCLDKMKEIPSESIDLVVTSPPYDNLRTYKDSLNWNFEIFQSVANELSRVLKQGGVIIWVIGDETKNFCESLSSFKQAIYFVDKCGLKLLDTRYYLSTTIMIYAKNGGPSPYPGLMRYAPWFEYMFVFTKGKPSAYNPIKDVLTKSGGGKTNSGNTARKRDGTTTKTGSYVTNKYKTRSNIWTYDVGKNKDTKDKIAMSHPARFPEKLAYDHIVSWSNEGDTVLDPFMGSGTTGKQAKLLNRNFIGIECVREYFIIAKQRIKDD